MRRSFFNMDALIDKALRESIESQSRNWEPEITPDGVGPVGDSNPFEEAVNESLLDTNDWEPEITPDGVGPVGDSNPFEKAVNESLLDTNDWERGSFGARDFKKMGISFADDGDECDGGVFATGRKNSGRVISSDNLSEGKDDEGEDEIFGWSRGEKNAKAGGYTWDPTISGRENRAARRKMAGAYANFKNSAKMAEYDNVTPQGTGDNTGGPQGTGDNTGGPQGTGDNTGGQSMMKPTADPSQNIIVGLVKAMVKSGQQETAINILRKNNALDAYSKILWPAQRKAKVPTEANTGQTLQPTEAPTTGVPKTAATEKPVKTTGRKTGTRKQVQPTVPQNTGVDPSQTQNTVTGDQPALEEKLVKEERDRFFNIINRIEKLYD